MKYKTKITIWCTFLTIPLLAIIFFILIRDSYSNWGQSSKDALPHALSFLSILTTAGAAFIAAALVSNWMDEHDYVQIDSLLVEMYDLSQEIGEKLASLRESKFFSQLAFFKYSKLQEDQYYIDSYVELYNESKSISECINKLRYLEGKVQFLHRNKSNIFKTSQIKNEKIDLEIFEEFYSEDINCLNMIDNYLYYFDNASTSMIYLIFNLKQDKIDGVLDFKKVNSSDENFKKNLVVLGKNAEKYFSEIFEENELFTGEKYTKFLELLTSEIVKNIEGYKKDMRKEINI